ncbi:MAG: hypothetical protein M8364_16230 [Methylobacter sp.]|uniref:hypothetical protein n=1 Tax=Methylobacter sp. TaxID=2051955 RepID=UPI0025867363|nr:hypothetical protein [Methylobacter sp.]MCL7422438.1 hypothetical protein [Methylobacter sp.]
MYINLGDMKAGDRGRVADYDKNFLPYRHKLVMMEIPNYHIPKLKNVLINSWTRVRAFVVRVGKIIITMVVLLSILSSLGTDGSFRANNIENSVLSAAGRQGRQLARDGGAVYRRAA